MKRILVVDDDKDILEAIELILEAEGFSSMITDDCESLSKKIMEYRPDLIMLDVLMSGFDGRMVAKNLKQDTKTKEIPIILISAHPSVAGSIQELGIEGYIPKPFDIDELLKLISDVIGKAEKKKLQKVD